MDKFFESLPEIIKAAAVSDLGIMALLIAAISVLSFFFFLKASEATRILIFLFLFAGVVGFGLAIFRKAPEVIEEQSNLNASLVTQPEQEVKVNPEPEVLMGYVEGVRQVQIEDTSGAVPVGRAGAAAEEGITRRLGLEITVRLDYGRLLTVVQEADEAFYQGERVMILMAYDGTTRVIHLDAALVTQPMQEVEVKPEPEVKLEQTPKPVKPAPPPPPKKEGWLAYRYDIFSCDSNPREAQNLASQISRSLKSAGIADVRPKRYDERFRKLAEEEGFSSKIYTSASIRYYGLKEERAAEQAQAFLYSKTGVNFELEEVDPRSPTPGILSIFVCPGFPDIPYPTSSIQSNQ